MSITESQLHEAIELGDEFLVGSSGEKIDYCKQVEDELRGEVGAAPRVYIRYPNGGYRLVSASEAVKYNSLPLAAKKLYQARHDPSCANVSGKPSRFNSSTALARRRANLLNHLQAGDLDNAEYRSTYRILSELETNPLKKAYYAAQARLSRKTDIGAKPASYYRMVQTPGGTTLRMAAHLADQWKALSPAQQRSLLWRATRNRGTRQARQLPCL